MNPNSVTNIAAYRFANLENLRGLRFQLLAKCRQWDLKGTILLSTEGINLFVAGPSESIDQLLAELRSIPGLNDLEVKVSTSQHQPFNRMLVKIKKEIISLGVAGIDPAQRPTRKVTPQQLKQWLDEGRILNLLDTRNDYEIKLGTFRNAVSLGIDHFREFPNAAHQLPAEWKQQQLVMFCTGGIRCEKAGPLLEQAGFRDVLQLDGGILKYFELCGSAHFQGECFVFDKRVGLDPGLQETGTTQCYACQSLLGPDDLADPRYSEGRSCPRCYRPPEQLRASTIAARQTALIAATTPLPGSTPYDNYRPVKVAQVHEGKTLLEFLCSILPHVPEHDWRLACAEGRMLDGQKQVVQADQIVRVGERYLHLFPGTLEPEVNPNISILHEDEAIIVLDKPAPLPVHPSGRFNRNTLQYILSQVYPRQGPRPAHRLDANTTGLIVFARTRRIAGILQPQFSTGQVTKLYWVRVQGHPAEDCFHCEARISCAAGETGTRNIDRVNGLESRTEFRVLRRLNDGSSLLEARPITGRTNQIRIHLWELGLPVCGDPTYLRNSQIGETQTLPINAPPLCLRSMYLEFEHPETGDRIRFRAAEPDW